MFGHFTRLAMILALGAAANITGNFMHFEGLKIGDGVEIDQDGNADFAGTITANAIEAPVVMDLGDLSNVNLSGLTPGDTIEYMEFQGVGFWVRAPRFKTFASLNDTTITTPVAGDILFYGNNNRWINGPLSIDQLSEFSISNNPANGSIFVFNQGVAMDRAMSGDVSINASGQTSYVGGIGNLPDVSVTPTEGDVLWYNGSEWISKALDSDLPSNPSSGNIVLYDGSGWIGVGISGDATLSTAGVLSIPTFSTATKGLVPQAPNDPTTFLSADGTFKVPTGTGNGGSIIGPLTSVNNSLVLWNGESGDSLKGSGILSNATDDLIVPGILTLGSTVVSNASGLLDGSKIQSGTVGSSQLASTTVTAGSYTLAGITVSADGRVTSASSGSLALTDLTDAPASYSGAGGKLVAVNSNEEGLLFVDAPDKAFTDLTDAPASYTGADGKVVAVNSTGTGLVFVDASSGGAVAFTDLTDVPASYTASKYVAVNSGGTGLEFVDAPSSGANAFTDLSDAPSTLVAGKTVKVNSGGTALEFADDQIGATSFMDLTDSPTGLMSNHSDGILAVNAAGDQLRFAQPTILRPILLTATGAVFDDADGADGPTRLQTSGAIFYTIDFDSSANEYAHWTGISIPYDFKTGGKIRFRVNWTAAESSSGGVVWRVGANVYNNGGSLDTTLGTPVMTTGTYTGVHELHQTSYHDLTISGSPQAGSLLTVYIYRDTTDPLDTFGKDACLLNLELAYEAHVVVGEGS